MGIVWNAIKETLWDKIPDPKPVAKVTPKEVCFHLNPSDPDIVQQSPDALVEMGREVASSVLAHPEKYSRAILGNQVLVVDDSSYEALFFLFSGSTREKLWRDKQTVAALFMGHHCVMSEKLYQEAQRGVGGLWG